MELIYILFLPLLLQSVIIGLTVVAEERFIQPIKLKILDNLCGCENQWKCQCCTAVNIQFLNSNQSLCGVWQFVPRTVSISMNVIWNDRSVLTTGISPDNAPPICMPLIPPVLLSVCVKVHNVTQNILFVSNESSNNKNELIGACTNATLMTTGFTLTTFKLGCVNINRNGIILTNNLKNVRTIGN